MPKIQQTIADVNVRSHTFHFVTPAMTDALKIPNACKDAIKTKSDGMGDYCVRLWADRSGPSPLSWSSVYTFTPSWLTGTKTRLNSLSAATE